MAKFCKHCGGEVNEDAVICVKCGRSLNEAPQAPAGGKGPYNKWVSVILCFFLGYLGAHKFYEGKIGLGILYLFTLGLFGIGVLVDFIVLLMKPDPYYL